jgi:glycosyltransferase involved in cell wall biosynthesis
MVETLIIIRTKNEDRWLKATLEKIFKQKYKNFLVAIVDNYSKDRTLEIAKRYNTKIFKIKKFIPGKAINIPIKKINSKFVVCLSAHCIPTDEDWLSNLIKPLKNKKVAAVYGKQMPMFNTESQNYRDLKIVFGNDKRIQKKDYFFHNANSAIRASLLKKYPFSDKATNIEDRLWAKQILDLNKNLQIIYEPKAAVFHHHGLHQSNNKKRLDGVIKIMKNIENENLYPDEFLINNQKIYACIIGNRSNNLSKKYIQTNKLLISRLEENSSIEKIIIVVNKKYFNKYFNKYFYKKNKKFLFIERSKYIKSLSIRNVLMHIYQKFTKIDIDYMMYFNLDYLERPKNFINELVEKALHGMHNLVVYALKDKTNLMGKTKNSTVTFKCLFGLGSIFYFNKLKNLSLKDKDIEMIDIKNIKYLKRESKK